MSYCQKDANFPNVISQAGISIIWLLFLILWRVIVILTILGGGGLVNADVMQGREQITILIW